jgi:hypothetical protein
MMLHITSFAFKVLRVRPVTEDNRIVKKMAMFIWEELRMHSMIFGLRSCAVLLYPEYSVLIMYGALALADLVSFIWGNSRVTTVRGNHDVEKNSWIKRAYSAFFSTSQMGATIICAGFFQKHPLPQLVFATLPAIQTSAFGMTLLRKNLITKQTWQIVYSIELLLVYFIWYKEYGNINIFFYSMLAYCLRVIGVNKYAMWGTFWSVHMFLETHPEIMTFTDIAKSFSDYP